MPGSSAAHGSGRRVKNQRLPITGVTEVQRGVNNEAEGALRASAEMGTTSDSAQSQEIHFGVSALLGRTLKNRSVPIGL